MVVYVLNLEERWFILVGVKCKSFWIREKLSGFYMYSTNSDSMNDNYLCFKYIIYVLKNLLGMLELFNRYEVILTIHIFLTIFSRTKIKFKNVWIIIMHRYSMFSQKISHLHTHSTSIDKDKTGTSLHITLFGNVSLIVWIDYEMGVVNQVERFHESYSRRRTYYKFSSQQWAI